MYFNRKLKPPIISTEMIIGIVVTVVFLFLLIFSFRIAMGFGALITFSAAILASIILARTHNRYFIINIIAQLLATFFLVCIAIGGIEKFKPLLIAIAGLMVIFQILMIIFILQRKMKWRTREVLELAALPVKEIRNGFTQRPMQAGKVNYSTQELQAFSSFIRQNLIAIPVTENNRTILIVNMPLGRLLTFMGRYEDRSWVAFDHEGNVSVNISQNDYFLYKDELAFDQLCQGLGNLFIDFMDKFLNGEGEKIIYNFNSLKLNIIAEG